MSLAPRRKLSLKLKKPKAAPTTAAPTRLPDATSSDTGAGAASGGAADTSFCAGGGGEGVVWEWDAGPRAAGRWRPYNPACAAVLEREFATNRAAAFDLSVADRATDQACLYRVDLRSMQQQNQRTGFLRRLRRRTAGVPQHCGVSAPATPSLQPHPPPLTPAAPAAATPATTPATTPGATPRANVSLAGPMASFAPTPLPTSNTPGGSDRSGGGRVAGRGNGKTRAWGGRSTPIYIDESDDGSDSGGGPAPAFPAVAAAPRRDRNKRGKRRRIDPADGPAGGQGGALEKSFAAQKASRAARACEQCPLCGRSVPSVDRHLNADCEQFAGGAGGGGSGSGGSSAGRAVDWFELREPPPGDTGAGPAVAAPIAADAAARLLATPKSPPSAWWGPGLGPQADGVSSVGTGDGDGDGAAHAAPRAGGGGAEGGAEGGAGGPHQLPPSHYYVHNFATALEQALVPCNAVLFSAEDTAWITLLHTQLSGPAPYQLALRLLNRARKYLRVSKLKYGEIAPDLAPVAAELVALGLADDGGAPAQGDAGRQASEGLPLRELLALGDVGDLKRLCKAYHIRPDKMAKAELIAALLAKSQQPTMCVALRDTCLAPREHCARRCPAVRDAPGLAVCARACCGGGGWCACVDVWMLGKGALGGPYMQTPTRAHAVAILPRAIFGIRAGTRRTGSSTCAAR